MRIVIGTTSGFHLTQLALQLQTSRHSVSLLSYLPAFRLKAIGIDESSRSLFWRLLPGSALALCRQLGRHRLAYVEKLLETTDEAIAECLPPCDVFIGLSGMAIKSAAAAKKKYGAFVIIDRGSKHVLDQEELLSAARGRSLSQYYIDRELNSYSCADAVALPSQHAVDSFVARHFPRNRLFLNQYGVDVSRFTGIDRNRDYRRLIFVGAWSYQKGVDILIDALGSLPGFTCAHVGMVDDCPFPNMPTLKRLGYRSHYELPEVLTQHDILVLPSRQDGFGMVLLEALACGLGVVATSATGGPDLRQTISNKDSVEIVRPGDASALADGIRALASRMQHRKDSVLGLTNDDRQYYSWAGYAERYMAFIENRAEAISSLAGRE